MPIHEFECRSCGHQFELLIMSKSELDEVRCPICESPDVTKLMSAATIHMGDKPTPPPAIPRVKHHSCPSGTCSTIDLPGHKK